MTIPTRAHWEIRTGGSATNGGFYYPTGGGGVDYSQQDTAQVAATDVEILATTTTIQRTGATPFNSNHVDNGIYLTGGTATTGWYHVVSESGGVLTLDRSAGTAGTGITGNLGGGLVINMADSWWEAITDGSYIWVGTGTHTLTANIAVAQDGVIANGICIEGYSSTHEDARGVYANRPTIAQGAYTINLDNYWRVRNFILTGTGTTMLNLGTAGRMEDLKITNTSGTANRTCGKIDGSYPVMMGCEADSTNGYGLWTSGQGGVIGYSWAKAGERALYLTGNHSRAFSCFAVGGTYGVYLNSDLGAVDKCTVYGATWGIYKFTAGPGVTIANCIIDNCTNGLTYQAADDYSNAHNINFTNCTTDETNVTSNNKTTTDPSFDNAAGDDFNIGADLTSAVPATLGSTTTNWQLGAVAQAYSAGGGGSDKIGKLVGFGGGLV